MIRGYQGMGVWEVGSDGEAISSGGVESVLALDSGDCCTTL